MGYIYLVKFLSSKYHRITDVIQYHHTPRNRIIISSWNKNKSRQHTMCHRHPSPCQFFSFYSIIISSLNRRRASISVAIRPPPLYTRYFTPYKPTEHSSFGCLVQPMLKPSLFSTTLRHAFKPPRASYYIPGIYLLKKKKKLWDGGIRRKSSLQAGCDNFDRAYLRVLHVLHSAYTYIPGMAPGMYTRRPLSNSYQYRPSLSPQVSYFRYTSVG